ncbi:hypothetical protein MMC26_002950 [Xylographa opegraphella]|nr:hypothetical protein [Xylographa opegraphella]
MEAPTDQLAVVELEDQTLPLNRPAGLEQIFACLKSKDDTQRFVGLTLLMRYLEGIQGNYDLILKCWHAIPDSFLTRLLRAKVTNDKEDVKSKEEAQIKFELGVTVLHTFISLLPTQQLQDLLVAGQSTDKSRRSWNLRIHALVVEKPLSSTTISIEIIQTLLSLATTSAGARLLYDSTATPYCWVSLLEQAPEQPMILEIISRTFIDVGLSGSEATETPMQEILQRLDVLLGTLLKNTYQDGAATKCLLDWFYKLFEALSMLTAVSLDPRTEVLGWLKPLIDLMQEYGTKHYNSDRGLQGSIVVLARLLLEQFPQFKPIFFDPSRKSGKVPRCYIFSTTLLIDIRATLPSLSEVLTSPTYPDTSSRLAASYDLVFAHLDYILQAEDEDENTDTTSLPFDLILKLRDDIGEAIRFTIESLCDRYNAMSESSKPSDLRLMAQDPLVISQIGALGFWLQGDDTASADDALEVVLRLYACGIDIAPLCMSVLEGMCRERKDLVQSARELVETVVGVDGRTRGVLEGAVEALVEFYEAGQREGEDEYEGEDGDEDDGGVYDYS